MHQAQALTCLCVCVLQHESRSDWGDFCIEAYLSPIRYTTFVVQVNPVDVTMALSKGAKMGGVTVVEHAPVHKVCLLNTCLSHHQMYADTHVCPYIHRDVRVFVPVPVSLPVSVSVCF